MLAQTCTGMLSPGWLKWLEHVYVASTAYDKHVHTYLLAISPHTDYQATTCDASHYVNRFTIGGMIPRTQRPVTPATGSAVHATR